MKFLTHLYIWLKLPIKIIFSFIVTYFSLKLFMDLASYQLIEDKDLLMPTIILSSALIALFNYKETINNNRNTTEWKQREQTILMFEKFDSVSATAIGFIFDYPNIVKWINDVEKSTHKNKNVKISFNDALSLFKNVYNDMKNDKNKDKYIKIGKSVNVKTRLSGLQTSTPYELEVLFVIPAKPRYEALAHSKYKKHRIRGEWFKPHKDIIDDIEFLKKDNDLTIYD